MEFTLSFLHLFWLIIEIVAPVIVLLLTFIVVLGQVAGRFEDWTPASTLYWSFITATTVGYGDIRPASRVARILAVVIALNGLVLFGVIASVAVSATTEAVRLHGDAVEVEEYREYTGQDIPGDPDGADDK